MESVYDMPDALEEPRKKPISTKTAKRKKQQEKKPTRKPCRKERPGKIITYIIVIKLLPGGG